MTNEKKSRYYFKTHFSIELNQKLQNSSVGASKVHSNTDGNNLERSNSIGGREGKRVE